MLKIRGHHLLCIHGFRGLGYSPDFVSNMQAILDTLMESPEMKIEAVDSPDAICAACPHLVEGACTRGEGEPNVAARDLEVLRKLSLEPGGEISVREVFARTGVSFSGGLGEICASCSWYELGYCDEGIRKLRNS
ncbi:MAG TPA: DUF1284 domain-containing protein [Armatimonadota bacterium]|jgi:hypothetical protein